ncbi:unnamed protein product [Penicillium camemberti]|uniref:Str. FM013 n=1 Tax=Penicillium camemberti (strain FM 013) TaxID=1429867 RepID=A0A0G4PG05_PENC3|nr:unnamed protein product [Penicillium camemberti]
MSVGLHKNCSFKIEVSRNPIPWLIQPKLTSLRKFVRGKINQCVQNKHYGGKETQEATALFRRLAFLCKSLGNSHCHLVAIIGPISNVISMIA